MLTALAVGCSKSFPTVDENAWIYDESLPVPIQFGSLSSEVATKAVIDHFPGGEFQQHPFGVFAWDEDSSDEMQVSAKSIFPNGYKRAEIWTANGISNIRFQEQGAEVKPAYYPMSSKYNYSFYAYHTGTEGIAGSYVGDSYVLNLNFSEPFNDVLWGKFAESDLPYGDELPRLFYEGDETPLKGFNARFSRAAGKQTAVGKEQYYPVINFEHICTAFRFYAKADVMTDSDYTRLSKLLKITFVSISNVPSAAVLTVASKVSDNEGKLVPVSEDCTVNMYFDPEIVPTGYKFEEGNGKLMKSGEGDRFFLPPGDYSQSVVTIGVTLDGSASTLEFPLVYEGSSEFEAGKCYSFIVIFKTIEDISLKATLSSWDENNVTTVDLDKDNEPVDNE